MGVPAFLVGGLEDVGEGESGGENLGEGMWVE